MHAAELEPFTVLILSDLEALCLIVYHMDQCAFVLAAAKSQDHFENKALFEKGSPTIYHSKQIV